MTYPAPPAQTEQQPKTVLGVGEMRVDPILESPSAREHAGEPIDAPGRLGGSKRLSTTANESATAPSAMAKPGAEKPSTPKEQTTLLDALEGMVGPAIQPPSP